MGSYILAFVPMSPPPLEMTVAHDTNLGAGMQKLVGASRALSVRPEFSAVQNLKSIDVISVRLWLDRKIDFQFPANVLAGFEKEAGSTFFDLNVLQVTSNLHGLQFHTCESQLSKFHSSMQRGVYVCDIAEGC